MIQHWKSAHRLAFVLYFSLAANSLADDRPNILFIFTDDHAPHAIGAYEG